MVALVLVVLLLVDYRLFSFEMKLAGVPGLVNVKPHMQMMRVATHPPNCQDSIAGAGRKAKMPGGALFMRSFQFTHTIRPHHEK